jgi:8-oxo-dGTP diphosphatase
VVPSIYVSNIVRNADGKFLSLHCLQKQTHKWRFPAGKVELHEPLLAAAARELREETGLEALSLSYHSHHTSTMDGGFWLGYYFLCDAYNGTPAVQEREKHDAIAWLSHDELSQRGASEAVLTVTKYLTIMSHGGVIYPLDHTLGGRHYGGGPDEDLWAV